MIGKINWTIRSIPIDLTLLTGNVHDVTYSTRLYDEQTDATTIQIFKEGKDQLRELGRIGETYDDVVRRLIRIAKGIQRSE